MKGNEEKLFRFMEGSSKRFIIPVYQRNYDWKIEQCKKLYDDLITVNKKNRRTHFFGSIVSVQNELGRQSEYLIIDGQQRLTTVSLLLLAMYRAIDEGKVIPKDGSLKSQIYEDFLVDKYQPQETRMKLKPIKNDQKAFSALFSCEDEFVGSSNLTINYRYFYDRILKEEILIDDLFDSIFRLEIINISLNHDDNPQLIFESLNSTGMDLSEGDKIRNYVLMGLEIRQQEIFYNKYWNKIEEYTKYDVSSFIRDYLSLKQKSTPAMKKVYFAFKEFVENKYDKTTEDLLIELLDYSKLYNKLLMANTKNSILNASILRMNLLETTVTRPFFMEVLQLFNEQKISEEDLVSIFNFVESYLFRRMICGIATNALNKIFLTLHKDVVAFDGTTENYLEKFKFVLSQKSDSALYPDDEMFVKQFTEKEVYKMRSKNKQYIFSRFENANTFEEKNIWRLMDEDVYSIEHIMPQTLSLDWKQSLGDSYQEVYDTWIHRMANLTLTAYNSSYSNHSFVEKRDCKDGFKDSGIRMNQRISQCVKWTEEELIERNKYLMDQALSIWPYCKSSYKPLKKQSKEYSLEEVEDMTGKPISKFSFRGEDYSVNTWTDMYLDVLSILHKIDPSILIKLADSTDFERELSKHVVNKKIEGGKYYELEQGIYIYTNMSTTYKINLLRKFFKLYDVEESDLLFYIDSKSKVGTKELRKDFWEFALPILKKETPLFQNVNLKEESWMSSNVGIPWIWISCVANRNDVKVVYYIQKSSNKLTKKIFDSIKANCSNVDDYIWERRDEKKVSKIYKATTALGIDNKDQWNEIVKYMCDCVNDFVFQFNPVAKSLEEVKTV